MPRHLPALVLSLAIGASLCAQSAIKAKVQQFAPVAVGVEETRIPKEHRATLKHIIEAAKIIDKLYMHQVAAENPVWRKQIAKDKKLTDTLAYFDIMYGPWDRIDEEKPFWGNKIRPKGANFYPEDLSVKELEDYIAKHPEQKEAFTSYFTVIKRDGKGLKAVPYSQEYKKWLEPAAKHLEAAAKSAKDARLAKYLRARAKAFNSNNYRESDMDWMDLGDGDLEVVIGPYEVYCDKLMGFKAAFEAFVTLRDQETSKVLEKIAAYVPEMQANLPVEEAFKGKLGGKEVPISVAYVLYNAGDNRPSSQTMAFNLPNDEYVRDKKGFKNVLLKNISEAKFNQILVPIVKELVRADQAAKVSHDAFFNHTLLHEIGHGLGPGNITVQRDGKAVESSVNQELKNLYSIIEETKADSLGLYNTLFLIQKGHHPESFREQVYGTFLGGFFRSVRFGAVSAHGKANAIQFNYMFEKGAITSDKDGKYGYDAAKMPDAIKSLVHDVLMIQAKGDYAAAEAFIGKYGKLSQDLMDKLTGLKHIPTDIRLSFPVEKMSKRWK